MLASRGQIKIHQILENNDFNFKQEYSFPDLVSSSGRPLRFDFVVFDDDGDIDFLIEYQGIQHYKQKSVYGGASGLAKQKYNDNLKRQYCRARGLRLLQIPYTDDPIVSYDYIVSRVYKD